jgi:hypothetical protein
VQRANSCDHLRRTLEQARLGLLQPLVRPSDALRVAASRARSSWCFVCGRSWTPSTSSCAARRASRSTFSMVGIGGCGWAGEWVCALRLGGGARWPFVMCVCGGDPTVLPFPQANNLPSCTPFEPLQCPPPVLLAVHVHTDGPPFATGLPHYGHLLAGTIKDIVTRYASQTGHHVTRRFGWDCHGLPVEQETEKALRECLRPCVRAEGQWSLHAWVLHGVETTSKAAGTRGDWGLFRVFNWQAGSGVVGKRDCVLFTWCPALPHTCRDDRACDVQCYARAATLS